MATSSKNSFGYVSSFFQNFDMAYFIRTTLFVFLYDFRFVEVLKVAFLLEFVLNNFKGKDLENGLKKVANAAILGATFSGPFEKDIHLSQEGLRHAYLVILHLACCFLGENARSSSLGEGYWSLTYNPFKPSDDRSEDLTVDEMIIREGERMEESIIFLDLMGALWEYLIVVVGDGKYETGLQCNDEVERYKCRLQMLKFEELNNFDAWWKQAIKMRKQKNRQSFMWYHIKEYYAEKNKK